MVRRGRTVFHITGIRHCDFKEETDAFIEKAAKTMLSVCFFPERTNQYDHEAVLCRYGRKRIGYIATYDLEKYHILAEKNDTDQLTGHFGHFSANVEDHMLKLYIPSVITLEEISKHRKKIDEQKDALYGSWKHNAIDHYLVHSRQQDDATACISQLKKRVVQLFGGHSTSTRGELTPILDDYKDCSQYDISLEGQQDRWDILLYLDLLHYLNHQPGQYRDEFFECLLNDVEDVTSQIAGELVRSVSYKSYIERLTELVTKHLPSSEAAQYYLNALPPEALNDIRQQVECFPHHLFHLFRTNPEEFAKTIYYARIPRRYLDPFLSGIALVEAYDNNKKMVKIKVDVEREEKEELDYEIPTFQLQRLLKGEWFKAHSDKKYTAKWTDAFVEELMASEYGEGIARDWAWNTGGERNRHIQIMGYVVGLLVDAGVLKGSKRSIAKRIVEGKNDRGMDEEAFCKEIGNLSRKMYTDTAGKQPYAQWVKRYVTENS